MRKQTSAACKPTSVSLCLSSPNGPSQSGSSSLCRARAFLWLYGGHRASTRGSTLIGSLLLYTALNPAGCLAGFADPLTHLLAKACSQQAREAESLGLKFGVNRSLDNGFSATGGRRVALPPRNAGRPVAGPGLLTGRFWMYLRHTEAWCLTSPEATLPSCVIPSGTAGQACPLEELTHASHPVVQHVHLWAARQPPRSVSPVSSSGSWALEVRGQPELSQMASAWPGLDSAPCPPRFRRVGRGQ